MPFALAEPSMGENEASASASSPTLAPVLPLAPPQDSAAARVEAVLDGLEAQGFLSAERFIAARIHARETRFGNLRIRREIEQHGLALAPANVAALRDSELARARAAVARRFQTPSADAAERARRGRFLAGRGFSFEVIAQVLREPHGGYEAEHDCP